MATPRPAMLPHDPHSQPWLHFTPRMHTIRRTATGVLAGYFEPRVFRRGALIPLANSNGVVLGQARVAGERDAREKERRLAKRKHKEGKARKESEHKDLTPGQSRPLQSRTVAFSADPTFVTPPGGPDQPDESLPISSNSLPASSQQQAFTSSVSSTPQPQSSATSAAALDSDRHLSQKKRKRAARPAPNRASTETSLDCPSLETDNDDDDDLPPSKNPKPNDSRPRGRPPRPRPSQHQPPQQQPDDGLHDPRPKKAKQKSRKGWKGWIELESSPEPNPKGTLIKLDEPVLLERKTRSGKFFDTVVTYPDSPRSQSSGPPAAGAQETI